MTGSQPVQQIQTTTAAAAPTADPADAAGVAHTEAAAAQATLAKPQVATDHQDTPSPTAAETKGVPAKNDMERLRESLTDASDLLRAALELLKSRLKDEIGKKAAKELEHAIQDLDKQRTQLGTGGLYPATGAIAGIPGLMPSLGNINIQA